MKKLGILFATVIMIMLFTISVSAKEVVDSGECGAEGDNVTWVLYDDGELVLSGTGDIKYRAFYDDDRITSVTFSSGITNTGEGAFYYCNLLSKVVLSDTVKTIDDSCFRFSSLEIIYIAKKVEYISDGAFSYCNNMKYFDVDDENQFFSDDWGVLLNKEKTILIKYPSNRVEKHYEIPNGVSKINSRAFYKTHINSLTIPDSVNEIGSNVFTNAGVIFLIYKGSKEQWNHIDISPTGNSYLFSVNVHTNEHIIEVSVEKENCVFEGKRNYICSCGDGFSETIPATNHLNATTDAGKAPTTTEVGYTAGKYCPDCKTWIEGHTEIPKLHSHSYTYLIIKTATCTISGIKEYVCSCGDTYTESIPATNHANATTDSGKAPTTTEVGYTAGKYCPDCKIWIEGHTEIPKLHTHSYASSITKTPTCTLTGTKIYTCTCGDTYTESIPATNHANATTDAGKAPTTTEVGYTAGKYCPDCKTWLEGHEEIPKLEAHEHQFAQVDKKHSTCTETGIRYYECYCGAKREEEIPMMPHVFIYDSYEKWPTCTEEGIMKTECSCGEKSQETIPANGHSLAYNIEVEATCTKDGLTRGSYCPNCDLVYEPQKVIPAFGHNFKIELIKGTLTMGGMANRVCQNCRATKTIAYYPVVNSFKIYDAEYIYDGKVKKPVVVVNDETGESLVEGRDYTLSYEDGRKLPGKYAIKITLMGNYEGEKTIYFSIFPGKTSKLVASQTNDTITLKWRKVEGATGYRVYQYNSKTKKYVKLKNTTGTSYTVKKLKAGTTYKFAVKAYTRVDGEVIWADSYKTLKTATKPATPTVKVTAGTKKATLSWNKVTGATGYLIYMRNSDGSYEKVGTTKKTSYTVSDLSYGEKCYFRVRAYKTVDGKNIYGGFKTYSATVPYPAVYVTPSGKRYHYDKECAGKNATKTTFTNAQKTKTPCKTCVI